MTNGKLQAALLGATGAVGQRFIRILDRHPMFHIAHLMASEKSAGMQYASVCNWFLDEPIPERIGSMVIEKCMPEKKIDIAFSGLDSSVAGDIEVWFAKAGIPVVSNSKNHRMDDDVPLIIPEVNPEHLELVNVQKRKYANGGYIVTNPNCSTIILSVGLYPLIKNFGVTAVIVNTMQGLSGAGYPGVSSLDVIDNIIPFIPGEEEKLVLEPGKIFGRFNNTLVDYADLKVSASCHRVPVLDGHLMSVSVKLAASATPADIVDCWKNEQGAVADLRLPSQAAPLINYIDDPFRPQPRKDRMAGGGMGITIGSMRKCNVLDYKFRILGHNTIRGAAGGAVLVAELLKAKGYL